MDNFKASFAALKNDNTSGAAELTQKALQCFQLFIKEELTNHEKIERRKLIDCTQKIIGTHPMASLEHTLCRVLVNVIDEGSLSVTNVEQVEKDIEEVLNQLEIWQMDLTEIVSTSLQEHNILIFSYSSTVMDALLAIPDSRKPKTVIYIPESRPLNEGHRSAEKLAKAGFKVILGIDMSISHMVKRAEIAVLGCDTLLQSGSVVNKMGSATISLWFSVLEKPVMVITDPTKLSLRSVLLDQDWKPDITENDPQEVTSLSHPNLTVSNKYFEIVPEEWISKVVIGNLIAESPLNVAINNYFNSIYTKQQHTQIKNVLQELYD